MCIRSVTFLPEMLAALVPTASVKWARGDTRPPIERAFGLGQTVRMAVLLALALAFSVSAAQRPPNIIHIIADDLGYDDIGCYGAKTILTPNLDRLAERGMRFTSYYAPAPLCSASRAALITGCYAERVGIPGALMPHSQIGLSDKETTIGELLKERGYKTAVIGKWHLGHLPQFLPTRHGFDLYFGIPYPNDQGPERNILPQHASDPVRPPIPLFRGDKVLEYAPNFDGLPHRFLDEALRFIADNRDRPFFLHFANIETHVPWFIAAGFQGRSKAGAYGDAVEYLDWSVGQIVAQVEALGLRDNTLIVFTSDNGMLRGASPDYQRTYGRFGSVDTNATHVLRGAKNTLWEGGVRVPFIASWPGRIPAGKTRSEIVAGFDLYATFAHLGGAKIPGSHVIDGKDLSGLLLDETNAQAPRDTFYYYHSFRLGAVRKGNWKLMMAPTGRGFDVPGKPTGKMLAAPQLFDLENDLAESTDVAKAHPEIVEQLKNLAAKAREDLGDSTTDKIGQGARPPGRVASAGKSSGSP